ncbi:MAG: GNAT family N-acetyltransferase [Alphaproteobacteria bacterium]|nr:GNAT family N-acetyltransferase [Alphaproteobacteria bacterium]
MNARWIIEPLGKTHNRAAFSCGVPALDDYLQRRASQDAKRRVAAPFMLIEAGGEAVCGYYTLSQMAVEIEDLPEDIAKKLPKYPMAPVTLLGRLAVDVRFRGQGLGEYLLMDALRRSWTLSREIAAMAVLVDAKDEAAASFYESYDFRRLPGRRNRLFLPMAMLDRLFAEGG